MPEQKSQRDLIIDALEKIFEQMKQQGLVTAEMEQQKTDIIKSLADYLIKNQTFALSIEDIKGSPENKEVQKKLMGALTTAFLGVKNEDNLFLKDLCSEKNLSNNPELDKKLMLSLVVLEDAKKIEKTLTPEPSPENKNADKDKDKDEKNEAKKGKTFKELLREEMENSERNMLGGVTASGTGKIPSIIEGPVFGNLKGYPSQATPDSNSVAFMTMSITYNSSAPDPLGLEGKLKQAEISNAGLLEGVSASLNQMTTQPTPRNEI